MNGMSKRTKDRMVGVHGDLQMVVAYALAISEVDFLVSEGVRTTQRQAELYAQGRITSGVKVTNADGVKAKSNHQVKADDTAHAVEVYFVGWDNKTPNTDVRWEKLLNAFKIASKKLGIPIEIGAYWNMKDFPHIQLATKGVSNF